MAFACGFEMMHQLRKRQAEEGKGVHGMFQRRLWRRVDILKGCYQGQEYNRLMQNAKEYYRNSSLHLRASEMLNAPAKRMDEILFLPHSADDFEVQDPTVLDDDLWLYNGDDKLNAALQE